MRKGRGVKNKDRGFIMNIILVTKEDWLTCGLIVLWASAGVMLGGIIGQVTTPAVIAIILIFLGIFLSGLLVAWFLDRNLSLLEQRVDNEELEKKHNAFTLIISELERNLKADVGSKIADKDWQVIKYELTYFSPHLYSSMQYIYESFLVIKEFEGSELRKVLHEELQIPMLVLKLKEEQEKIKNQLPSVDELNREQMTGIN